MNDGNLALDLVPFFYMQFVIGFIHNHLPMMVAIVEINMMPYF